MNKKVQKNGSMPDIFPLISQMPIAAFLMDKKGQNIFSNHLWLDATGLKEEEMQSLPLWDLLNGPIIGELKEMVQDVFSGKKPAAIIASICNKKEQKKSFFKISATLFQEEYALFSAIDVSEQINLQETLIEKKKQIFSMFSSLGDAVFKIDRKLNYLHIWKFEFLKAFPHSSNPQGKSMADHFPEKVVQQFHEAVERSVSSKKLAEMEFSVLQNGKKKWFLAKIAPILGQVDKEIKEFTVIVREITEERKNRLQIEYKNKLISQLTSIPHGPVLHVIERETLNFNYFSGDISSLTGYTAEELKALNWLDIIYENDREYVKKYTQELVERESANHRNIVYRIVTKERKINWVTDHLSISRINDKKMIVGVLLNVTEVHLLNHELKQRDRILTQTGKVAKIGGWEYDFKTRQTLFTDEVYEIFEIEKGTLQPKEILDFYIEEHRSLITAASYELFEAGKGYDMELQIKTGKGQVKWVKTIGSAIWAHGQLSQLYGVLQDITEKKEQELEIQANEKRFNVAFELAPIGKGLVTTAGKWLKINLAFCRFLEYKKEEIKELSLAQLGLDKDLEKALKLSKNLSLKKGGFYQHEKKFLAKSGEKKWGRLSLNIIKNEEGIPLYAIIQVVDITKNKRYEKDLKAAKKLADAANKAKSEFLSSMSHEIRTPLNGVIGISNLLLEDIQDPQQRERLEALRFSSNSLLLIVNDILDFSKIKSGAITLESQPFSLKNLLEAVKESNTQKANEWENKITLHFDERLPHKFMGDELRVGQILNNLVMNAVKFTKKGTIDITVKKVKQTGKWYTLLFSIKDNGIGIAKNMQSVIFDQFIQAETGTSRKHGGTGLGLSIVKGLLKAMNSEAKVSSELGRGTEIYFQLTLPKAGNTTEERMIGYEDVAQNLHKKTILLVEDNMVNAMVVTDYIKKWNGEVLKAENGSEAIEVFKLNRKKIKLILMDLQMPVMNGFEATAQIKKIDPNIPVVALTGSIGDRSKLEAFDYGMAAYVIKPFLPNDFYNTLKRFLL